MLLYVYIVIFSIHIYNENKLYNHLSKSLKFLSEIVHTIIPYPPAMCTSYTQYKVYIYKHRVHKLYMYIGIAS